MIKIAIFILLIVSGCNNFSTENSNTLVTPPPPGAGPGTEAPLAVKYFGYYASMMDGIGVMADIDELKDKSNFIFIHHGDLKNILDKCRETGMKAMVSNTWYYYDANFRILPDWKDRIAPVLDLMEQYQDVIIAHYILDEPYMNGYDKGVTLDEMYNSLNQIGEHLKTRFPEIPIAVILSATEMKQGFKIPPSFDWVGMDCYDSFTWCGKQSIPGYYNMIKNELAKLEQADGKKRHLMAVPPAGWEKNNASREDNHFNQVANYRKFIKDEKINIIVPFIWQSFGTPEGGGWYGARDSVKLKDAYIKLYGDFMAGTL